MTAAVRPIGHFDTAAGITPPSESLGYPDPLCRQLPSVTLEVGRTARGPFLKVVCAQYCVCGRHNISEGEPNRVSSPRSMLPGNAGSMLPGNAMVLRGFLFFLFLGFVLAVPSPCTLLVDNTTCANSIGCAWCDPSVSWDPTPHDPVGACYNPKTASCWHGPRRHSL